MLYKFFNLERKMKQDMCIFSKKKEKPFRIDYSRADNEWSYTTYAENKDSALKKFLKQYNDVIILDVVNLSPIIEDKSTYMIYYSSNKNDYLCDLIYTRVVKAKTKEEALAQFSSSMTWYIGKIEKL